MNLIVAVDRNWGIGCGNKLLARIPEDMAFFRETTMNKTVVMGRKTFESLPNGALPNRTNIVLTRNKNFTAENVIVHTDLDSFFEWLKLYEVVKSDDIFVIGGEQIYKQALKYCNRAYITKIDAEFSTADKFMGNLDLRDEWQVESVKKIPTQSGVDIEFVTYVKH